MKKNLVAFCFLLIIAFQGCSQTDSVNSPVETQLAGKSLGKISINYEKDVIPSDVYSIQMILSRDNYDTLKTTILPHGDTLSITQATFDSVASGLWTLNVEAQNLQNVAIYKGQTNIYVTSGNTAQVSLTLTRVQTTGVGKVIITIQWDNSISDIWTDYMYNPILTSSNKIWDIAGVFSPKIIYENNKYKMWYGGLSYSGTAYTGYAYSADGENWTKSSQQPILKPGNDGEWDDGRAGVGPVIKINGSYYMYYQGWSKEARTLAQIGMAVSSDGINWIKNSRPVLSCTGTESSLLANSIIKIDNTFYLYYSYFSSIYNSYVIGLATSTNGISWARYSDAPILVSSQSWEEGYGIGYVSVYFSEGKYKMIYSGISDLTITGLGSAESNDGIHWVKADDNPVFTDKNSSVSWNTTKILYPCYAVINNQERVYYTGIDKSTGILSIAYIKK